MGRALRIWNQLAPTKPDGSPGDPTAWREIFDFSTLSSIDLNLYDQISQNELGFVQSLYVDNSQNNNTLEIISGIIEQRISVPAGVQLYIPVLTADPPVFNIATTAVAGLKVTIFFCNVPFASISTNEPCCPLPENAATATHQVEEINQLSLILAALGGAVQTDVDASGTLAAGGVSQVVAAAAPAGNRVIIFNPTTAAESLFVNSTGAATVAGTDSFEVVPGGYYDTGEKITNAVQVNAVTIGHVFVAKIRS